MGRPFGYVKFFRVLGCCLAIAGIVTSKASAQTTDNIAFQNVASDPPAHVSLVDGSAALERDGRRDPSPTNMPLLSGDRLRTENGRVEILFGDNSTLHLDTYTTIDFQSDELVRLLDGRVRLAIPERVRQVSYRVDAPSASAVISEPGEYRISILRGGRDEEVELAVLRGSAELVNDGGRTLLRAGQRAYARADAAPSYVYAFNSASWDDFDRWSETRRDQRFGVSTQYLPSEVQPYASAFDQYGSWQYNTSYGYVWYPSVAVGWRPYYYGRWVPYRPYGWTWVGVGPWAWPTHHYGRWGFSAGAWFWIPGQSWGPAWVSWAYAPGYVSWCPLGWNNHAVFAFGFTYGYNPWHAWTVVPYGHFGHGYVHVNYVGPHGFTTVTNAAFVPRHTAPAWSGYAVPRSSSPIHVAGTAPPRTPASTVYTNLAPGASRVATGGQRVVVGPSRSTVTQSPVATLRAEESNRAVPRGVTTPSASNTTGVQVQAGSARIGNTPASRENPYSRRAPETSTTNNPPMDVGSRPQAVPRVYQPYGMPDAARSRSADNPVYVVPRTAPPIENARPVMPEYVYPTDRRAPAVERPPAPPSQIGAPGAPGGGSGPRGNPGVDRGAPAPEHGAGGAPAGQGHSRGGQSSSGHAAPRGRG